MGFANGANCSDWMARRARCTRRWLVLAATTARTGLSGAVPQFTKSGCHISVNVQYRQLASTNAATLAMV